MSYKKGSAHKNIALLFLSVTFFTTIAMLVTHSALCRHSCTIILISIYLHSSHTKTKVVFMVLEDTVP